MNDLDLVKTCELHVHPGGCLTVEDLLDLGRDIYRDLDWSFFVTAYEEAFGVRPDPVGLYEDALSGRLGGIDRFREHYVYGDADGGDFGRFQAKFNLILCLLRHADTYEEKLAQSMRRTVERHAGEGITYAEYRSSCGSETPEGFVNFHRIYAEAIQAAPSGMSGRYIVSLRRWMAEQDYDWMQLLMDEHPELVPTVVGIDFAHFEEGFPPKDMRDLLARVYRDNERRPERALEIVYHVGESYFDKSLESAVRWCHEVAEMGVKRLGHAIALGLDPEVAVARRPNAHVKELVRERLDQIGYDLGHAEGLRACGIAVDTGALENEQIELQNREPDGYVERLYDDARLEEVRRRQQFVLDRLVELGTVIETCPTSNLRIGGVPDPVHHPIHMFLKSGVNLAICSDDPGIFDVTLADEVEWVLKHTGWSVEALQERLGEPRRWALIRSR